MLSYATYGLDCRGNFGLPFATQYRNRIESMSIHDMPAISGASQRYGLAFDLSVSIVLAPYSDAEVAHMQVVGSAHSQLLASVDE